MKKGWMILLAGLLATSAQGWYGGDDHNGWSDFDGYGAHDGRWRGDGRGRAEMDGNFSMTINANGRAHTDMDTDFDSDWDLDYHSDSGWGSVTYPVYYYPVYGQRFVNPTAGYEAHRELVERNRK